MAFDNNFSAYMSSDNNSAYMASDNNFSCMAFDNNLSCMALHNYSFHSYKASRSNLFPAYMALHNFAPYSLSSYMGTCTFYLSSSFYPFVVSTFSSFFCISCFHHLILLSFDFLLVLVLDLPSLMMIASSIFDIHTILFDMIAGFVDNLSFLEVSFRFGSLENFPLN
jgi:hypothetical protein